LQILGSDVLGNLQKFIPGLKLHFLHLSVLMIGRMGVPQKQALQALEMIITIFASTWGEPMFVKIQAKDISHTPLFVNLCTKFFPSDFYHESYNDPMIRNRTIVIGSSNATKKKLAELEEIFVAFMDGKIGFLGALPETHSAFYSRAIMTIDLDADTSDKFRLLSSSIEKAMTSGISLLQVFEEYVPQFRRQYSCEKFIELYKKICQKNWMSEKAVDVNDEPFLKEIQSLTEGFQEQTTARKFLCNVVRFNNILNPEAPSAVTASKMDYAIFFSMMGHTFKAWERVTLGLSEEEILIIRILEHWMVSVIEWMDWDLPENEVITHSAQEKSDFIFEIIQSDACQALYCLPDDSTIEEALKKLDCRMSLDARQKCYKSLKDKGIIEIKKFPYVRPATCYILLRFELLKEGKFQTETGKFKEVLNFLDMGEAPVMISGGQ
jgi:hypothetical protein